MYRPMNCGDGSQERDMEEPPIMRSDIDNWCHDFQAPDDAEISFYERPAV